MLIHPATVDREFHISRQARDRYQFDAALFALSGNTIIADFQAARRFAQKINAQRDLIRFPEQAVQAGEINALGLIDEILHRVVKFYREQRNPAVWHKALTWLYNQIGQEATEQTLLRFVTEFPPLAVYRAEMSPAAYLEGETAGQPNRHVALEEMLLLWLANANPAFTPFRELFDDSGLERETAYRAVIATLHDFFETQPAAAAGAGQNLIDLLRRPALAFPHSLRDQLAYLQREWGSLLDLTLSRRLLFSLDLIREETRPVFGGGGPGPAPVYEYAALISEPERFSPDLDWMPRLVLIAKNAYVWLDQLSKFYRRPITRLDQIPDQELDTLARWGITGLWLIGLWERSKASQRIKQLCGNPEAVASAYSLFDYQIAADLGGEPAYQQLKERAWRRGIRLASDMVPNHTGIDSRWVIEHPDWFIALDHSPFPTYSFTGPDLSWDSRVEIRIEDHYYNRTDAAVVFQRVDRWTGDVKYIYHGNDGTSMPWNDTAQLNYLKPEVREALIQTILHVARLSPVIRFDAAMTLTKRHYQRLWYPEPGSGGDIPSRAGYGLSKAQFDAAMPVEFWREVVDRVAAEAPDTLLLAEAFWLMEGYFVRTLGMHRVYNSAFMNMLRDEENAKYRQVMKNTLEFDPEVLKRFVNFMNNPDERTAVDQFGKGDKYFGVCTLMATLPGLPMFGHGQVEGYTEKYGMEYRRAYYDEWPDDALVRRHEREIFPLLHRRRLFAEVTNFRLYDFFTPEGHVNEDVFAYSNRIGVGPVSPPAPDRSGNLSYEAGEERALVVYHNRYATTRGTIRTSVAYSAKTSGGGERQLIQQTLGEGLALPADAGLFWLFRDGVTGLEHIYNSHDLCEQGLDLELGAYQRHVFLDWRPVRDSTGQPYARLAMSLRGRGVPSIAEALQEISLSPVLTPFRELVNADLFRRLISARLAAGQVAGLPDTSLIDQVEAKTLTLLRAIKDYTGGNGDAVFIARDLRQKLTAIVRLPALETHFPAPRSRSYQATLRYLHTASVSNAQYSILLGWLFTHALGAVVVGHPSSVSSRTWLDEWLLGKVLAGVLQELGLDSNAASRGVTLIKVLTTHQDWFKTTVARKKRLYRALSTWLQDDDVRQFIQVNRFNEVVWFNKESFEELVWWLLLVATVTLTSDPARPAEEIPGQIAGRYRVVRRLLRAEQASGYQVEKLLEALRDG